MNNAVPPNETGMAALIGKDSNYNSKNYRINNNLNLEIANDNSNMQIVISGNKNEINKSKEIFLNNNIKKFVTIKCFSSFS